MLYFERSHDFSLQHPKNFEHASPSNSRMQGFLCILNYRRIFERDLLSSDKVTKSVTQNIGFSETYFRKQKKEKEDQETFDVVVELDKAASNPTKIHKRRSIVTGETKKIGLTGSIQCRKHPVEPKSKLGINKSYSNC